MNKKFQLVTFLIGVANTINTYAAHYSVLDEKTIFVDHQEIFAAGYENINKLKENTFDKVAKVEHIKWQGNDYSLYILNTYMSNDENLNHISMDRFPLELKNIIEDQIKLDRDYACNGSTYSIEETLDFLIEDLKLDKIKKEITDLIEKTQSLINASNLKNIVYKLRELDEYKRIIDIIPNEKVNDFNIKLIIPEKTYYVDNIEYVRNLKRCKSSVIKLHEILTQYLNQ